MNTQLLSIKAKKFGVRLAAFRQNKGLTTDILSQWTGISCERLKQIELGEATISLPEIELIALKLGFTTETLLTGEIQNQSTAETKDGISIQFAGLRDRMIGLILRKTRMEQNLAPDTIAASCGLTIDELEKFESGVIPVPLPVLECLCSEYQIPVLSLVSQQKTSDHTPIALKTIQANFYMLPDNMINFVNNPANLPYLELARKLSELDAAKLRNIAEGLLEITY